MFVSRTLSRRHEPKQVRGTRFLLAKPCTDLSQAGADIRSFVVYFLEGFVCLYLLGTNSASRAFERLHPHRPPNSCNCRKLDQSLERPALNLVRPQCTLRGGRLRPQYLELLAISRDCTDCAVNGYLGAISLCVALNHLQRAKLDRPLLANRLRSL